MGELSDEGTGATSYGSAMVPLPADYTPGDFDVLVGRGKACRTWKGKVATRE